MSEPTDPPSLASLIEEAEKDEVALKAWKLIEALAEKCDQRDYDDHAWRECRRCLALAELEVKGAHRLMRALLRQRALLDHLIAGVGRREKDQDVHTRMDRPKPVRQHIAAGSNETDSATVSDTQKSNEALVAALTRIAEWSDCQCDHGPDCCAKVPDHQYHCPGCIAAVALGVQN